MNHKQEMAIAELIGLLKQIESLASDADVLIDERIDNEMWRRNWREALARIRRAQQFAKNAKARSYRQ